MGFEALQCLGAAGEVTGSGYALKKSDGKITLIDFGSFQGDEKNNQRNLVPPDIDINKIDAVIGTHPHVDHIGRWGYLRSLGYNGSFFLTEPAARIAPHILNDAVKVTQSNGKPICSLEDVQGVVNNLRPVKYNVPTVIGGNLTTFYDAEHIIGSASVKISEGRDGKGQSGVFSGDLGNHASSIARPKGEIGQADWAVVEDTYGGRQHPSEDPGQFFMEQIRHLKQHGTLLVSAFAQNGLQKTLVALHKEHRAGRLNRDGEHIDVPIFVHAPLGMKITTEYLSPGIREYWSDEMNDLAKNPFYFPGVVFVDNTSMVRNYKGKKVVLASGGMCNGGPILGYLEEFAPDKDAVIMPVGYQGEETRGRQLIDPNTRFIDFNDRAVPLRARVVQVKSMSSHADHPQLYDWLRKIQGLQTVIFTHGDDPARDALEESVHQGLNIWDTHKPHFNDTIFLAA
ncbi:MAG TPA: MBL fold metallo-hydrolase [Patescibacteria group bacterium]|nr:MBL fold metallo-hydrolase [Patescibacteria group bacterium]